MSQLESKSECDKLFDAGQIAEKEANYDLAIQKYKEAYDCFAESCGNEESAECAICLNSMGAVHNIKGKFDKALELQKKALTIRLKCLGTNHPDTAGSYHSIGNIYLAKGESDLALENYNNALEIRLIVLGEMHLETAKTRNNIGNIYINKGEYVKALEHYMKSLEIKRKIVGEDNASTGISYSSVGNAYYWMSESELALEYQKKALSILLKTIGEMHPQIASVYNNIGTVFTNTGDYIAAYENFDKALMIRRKLFGENHPDTAMGYHNIGVNYHCRMEYDLALENYKRAQETYLQVFGEFHPSPARVYENIGRAYYFKDMYPEALENLNKALAISLKISGLNHPWTASIYCSIGQVYEGKGDYESALDFFKRAFEIFLETCGDKYFKTSDILNEISSVYKRKSDLIHALEFAKRAVDSIRKNANEPPSSLNCDIHEVAMNIFSNLAELFLLMENYDTSCKTYEEAAIVLESLRGEMRSEESRKFQGQQYYDMFPKGMKAFAKLYKDSRDKNDLERAFVFCEKGIARTFLEMIGQSRAIVDGGLPHDVISQRSNLKAKRKREFDKLNNELSKPREEQSKEFQVETYERLEMIDAQLDEYHARLLAEYPEYAELMSPRIRSLSEIRDKIFRPDEAALEYILGEESSFLLFITKDDITIHQLADSNTISNEINRFRNRILDFSIDPSTHTRKDKEDELVALLLGPVMDDLADKKNLLIVPTGHLYFLPFESLKMYHYGAIKYLIERFDIRYAPSLNVLYLAENRKFKRDECSASREWIGFGDPVYDKDDDRSEGKEPDDNTDRLRSAYASALRGDNEEFIWPRLTHSRYEILGIANFFNLNGLTEEVNLDLSASEARFKQITAEGVRYIHAATHGTLGEGNIFPYQPALIFSLIGNETSGEDGFLTMTDILNMKIPSEMVVLSACETGCGKLEGGEGVAGLARAFLYAGSDSLIVSLWGVHDELTKDLMLRFYENLKYGKDKQAALRHAKIQFIEREVHPLFWAPFIYIGTI